MDIILLLIFASILVFVPKPKNRDYYRTAMLSLVGISYFSIWVFIDYYLDTFNAQSLTRTYALPSLMVTVLLSGLLPWMIRINKSKTAVLVLLFILSTLTTLIFEQRIKNEIAKWAGFFDDEIMLSSSQPEGRSKLQETTLFNHAAGGFNVNVPRSWQKHTINSGAVYFERHNEGKKIAEFRPTCFHDTKLPVTEIVSNMTQNFSSAVKESEKQCSFENNQFICFINVSETENNKITQRWRWLVMDKNQAQNIELDFIIYKNKADPRTELISIIRSLEVVPISPPRPLCASSINWL